MKVYGLMVTRNEVDRFLDCSLNWHMTILDGLVVYDDHSDDGTPQLAAFRGAVVRERPEHAPGFMQHEGQFRQAAWDAFVEEMQPTTDDWVLALDADEFFVCNDDEQDMLWGSIARAQSEGRNSVTFEMPEIFEVTEQDGYLTDPQIRVDGFWQQTTGRRLVRFQPGGVFADKAMACGSAPTYAGGEAYMPFGAYLLHYGYALEQDRKEKFARYSSVPNGHNPSHIASILEMPVLTRWTGPHFKIWRGVVSLDAWQA